MKAIIEQYIPQEAIGQCEDLLKDHKVVIKVVNHRVTRHGDYRRLADGFHQITVNASLNPYRFLITLVHEIAHLHAFENFGRHIKPHGREWKTTFQDLMLPFLRPEVFPSSLLPHLAKHFINPKASSATDTTLSLALNAFDAEADVTYVFDIPNGGIFSIYNGKHFRKVNKRTKRYECVEVKTGKRYLFQPHTKVEKIID